MSLYKQTLKSIRDNKNKRLSGDMIAIPWKNLPKLSKVLPGVIKENYCIISANQKVGKTQIADYLYLYQPIDWLYENRDSNLDIDIHYFSLELSKEAKVRQAMAYRLYTQYGIVISPQDLRSVFDDYILEDEIEMLLEQEQEWFSFFESKVTFHETRNPYGIYAQMRHHFEANGSYERKKIDIIDNGVPKTINTRYKYLPNDPDKITVILLDHASLSNRRLRQKYLLLLLGKIGEG